MSGGHFNYKETYITQLAEDYRKFNVYRGEKYSDLKKIPLWVIKVLDELGEIAHEIDRDLSGDSSIEKKYFEKKRKKIAKIISAFTY